MAARTRLSVGAAACRCGLEQSPRVTSLSEEVSPTRRIGVDEVAPRFEAAFARTFDTQLDAATPDDNWIEEILADGGGQLPDNVR